ncbi:adenylate kinase family protein [Streptomyces parvus]|uniref:adenylate kinase family protein n=1 Tax=Streptomyces parvus TaxID=66428 RepID=UPI003642BC34
MPTVPAASAASGHPAKIPVLLLAGPPGAGKSTAMAAFRRRFPGLIHFGVRVFFERQMEQGTPLGQQAEPYHVRKIWHPDELVFAGVDTWLDESLADATCAVIEGFPRNETQALALDRVLGARGLRVNRMVYLDVPDEVCEDRVMNREVCTSCETSVAEAIPVPGSACSRCGRELVRRPDDGRENFRRRLMRQRQGAEGLLAHYEELGVLVRIDGTRPAAQVAAALREAAPRSFEVAPAR